jgi:hypothetical protein
MNWLATYRAPDRERLIAPGEALALCALLPNELARSRFICELQQANESFNNSQMIRDLKNDHSALIEILTPAHRTKLRVKAERRRKDCDCS